MVFQFFVRLEYHFQIFVQSHPIPPDVEPHQQSGRNDDSENQIQPAVVEQALMSFNRQVRIFVQHVQQDVVLAV